MTSDRPADSMPASAPDEAALRAAAARHYLRLPEEAQANLISLIPEVPGLHQPVVDAY